MTADHSAPEGALVWLPENTRVDVGGIDLSEGLVYLRVGDEPSAIDPELAVDRTQPDWKAHSVTGPVSYDRLTPQARAAYLRWLDSGRRLPPAPTVWPLLFLYGLERRVLLDGDPDPGLRHEAAELDRVYGHDAAVHRVAQGLVAPPRAVVPPEVGQPAVPADLVIELGRRALAGRPVDAAWALAWARYHPDVPTDPAGVDLARFDEEWAAVFARRHPDGYLAAAGGERLTIPYSPSNPSLPPSLPRRIDDAADVFSDPDALGALRAVAKEVDAALRPPVSTPPGPMAEVVDNAEDALGAFARAVVDAARLFGDDVDRLHSRTDAVALSEALDAAGIGLEPDVRFGGAPIVRGQQVVLFRVPGAPLTAPSPAYARAVVTLELCFAVVTADGRASDAGRALLVEQVDRVEDLTDAERARLTAHRRLLATRRVDLDDVAARVRSLDVDVRRQLGTYVLEVALVDGVLSVAERETLRSVADLLGLDPAEIDPQLGDPTAPAPPPPTKTPTVDLDRQRLERTQAANTAVQQLLGSIFADDEDDLDDEPPTPTGTQGPTLGGLDARHSELLRELAVDRNWTRRQWEAASNRQGVLPDGALDVINEAAIDRADDPVIEIGDDDSVTIDPDVYEEMRA